MICADISVDLKDLKEVSNCEEFPELCHTKTYYIKLVYIINTKPVVIKHWFWKEDQANSVYNKIAEALSKYNDKQNKLEKRIEDLENIIELNIIRDIIYLP